MSERASTDDELGAILRDALDEGLLRSGLQARSGAVPVFDLETREVAVQPLPLTSGTMLRAEPPEDAVPLLAAPASVGEVPEAIPAPAALAPAEKRSRYALLAIGAIVLLAAAASGAWLARGQLALRAAPHDTATPAATASPEVVGIPVISRKAQPKPASTP